MWQEYHITLLLSALIRNDKIEGTWMNACFTGSFDERFLEIIIDMSAEIVAISYVATSHIDIFNTHLELEYMRSFYDTIVEDHKRIIKLMELSKDGNSTKLTFKAGKNYMAVRTLNIPEKMNVEDTAEDQTDE